MNAPLTKKLENVEWGEYVIKNIFKKIKVQSLKYKTSELPNTATTEFTLPALTAGIQNQGLNNFVPRENATILKKVISISANGANTGATFFQSKEFTVLQDAYAIEWRDSHFTPTEKQYIFLTNGISKAIYGNYEWTNKAGWDKIKHNIIKLPTRDGEIDFAFMEEFIAELEAYLTVTGLSNYTLTSEEEQALKDLEEKKVERGEFTYGQIFNNIKQGRRLKKDDQISGSIPFIMAGTTNTGVVNCISNPIATFPKKSITIDIFGNTFYRNYGFGAGDDTGVYWSTEKEYTKSSMLFFTSAIQKSLTGKFSYGHKLRSSQSLFFAIKAPQLHNVMNHDFMDTLISAVQKLVIKDVVLYSQQKRQATADIITDRK